MGQKLAITIDFWLLDELKDDVWKPLSSPTSAAQPDPSVKTNTCQLREVK